MKCLIKPLVLLPEICTECTGIFTVMRSVFEPPLLYIVVAILCQNKLVLSVREGNSAYCTIFRYHTQGVNYREARGSLAPLNKT